MPLRDRLARAIDSVLGLSQSHTTLMRIHMASMLQEEGFIQCPEQQRLAALLRDTVARYGAADPEEDPPVICAVFQGFRVTPKWLMIALPP